MTPNSPASPRRPWDVDLIAIAPPDDHLFALTDPYLELCWAAHIGPSATLLARAIGRHLDHRAGGGVVDIRELATAVGIPSGTAEDYPTINARVARSLQRLTRFRLLLWQPERQRVTSTGRVRPVPATLLDRVLPETRRIHVELVTAALDARDHNDLTMRPDAPSIERDVGYGRSVPPPSSGRGR